MHFASDNSGPVHPKVMAALAAANDGYAMPYGADDLVAEGDWVAWNNPRFGVLPADAST